MKYSQIPDPKDGGNYHIGQVEDFEYAKPLDKLREIYLGHTFFSYKILFAMQKIHIPMPFIESLFGKKAESEWQQEFERVKAITIPPNLEKILVSTSKSEQEKLLRGLSLTTDELQAFIHKCDDNGYSWSQYKSSHNHKGFDESLMPELVEIQDGKTVHVIGETKLSEAQLKQAVEHRSVKVSKFFDKGNNWHCFFLTYKSLGGKENWKNGQPHLHYISNFWTIPRANVVAQLQNRDYSLPSLPHIEYYTHRNPKA